MKNKKLLILMTASLLLILLVGNIYAQRIFLPLTSGGEELAQIAVRQLAPGEILNVACSGIQLIVEQLSSTTAKLTCTGNATPTATATSISPTPTVRPTNTPPSPGDPVFVGAGDISGCNQNIDEATAKLLDAIPGTVFTLGDNVYPDGATQQFNDCYAPTWGRHKARTKPAVGNHDYHTAGAAGYYAYFGAVAAGPNGYYSYNLGQWHIIALNSEVDVTANSAQVNWLKADLAANPKLCTLAYWHKARFSSSSLHGSNQNMTYLWQALYAAGADVVLSGHDHLYERFAPQNPSGQADPTRGIREFVVGTGGAGLYPFGTPIANSEVRNNVTHGVLKLTLHATSYDWQFVPVAGKNFTDSGNTNCVGTGVATATPVSTNTPLPTSTFTPVPTNTPIPTATPTNTPTNTPLPTATSTNTPVPLTEVTYIVDNSDFSNPERGFMHQKSIFPDQSVSQFSGIKRDNPADSLVWIYFRLDNYRTQPLDTAGLALIRAAFADVRAKKLKAVIRFVYNPGPGSTQDPNLANPDAPLALVLQHIEQLKPILIENADVIAVLQAGFVGHWGEWHSSKYLDSVSTRQTIVDTLLDTLPADRMLQIRYPRYKEVFYGGPLVASNAFSNTSSARVGHHNDCFLRDDDDTTYRSKDVSTYCQGSPLGEIACWKDFVVQESVFTPVGGETCQVNPPRSLCPNAMAELEQLHWSFIHGGYQPQVLAGWVSGGCMPTIRLRLGYRFVLERAIFSSSVRPGGTLNLEVQLSNSGYASLYNQRPVFAVLTNGVNRYELPLPAIDPRRWEAGKAQVISVVLFIPSNVVPGTYQLSLWLPDQYNSLRSTPAYAVRFANTGVWDADTGLNLLTNNGSAVTVTQP